MKLTTCLDLVLRLKMSGAIPVFLLYAFMVSTKTTLSSPILSLYCRGTQILGTSSCEQLNFVYSKSSQAQLFILVLLQQHLLGRKAVQWNKKKRICAQYVWRLRSHFFTHLVQLYEYIKDRMNNLENRIELCL